MTTPFADPNDRFSYEHWMNETAADEGEPSRGWRAFFQDRCDRCGRFVNADAPGVSWSQSWSYDMGGTPGLDDPTLRCSPCTDKHGIEPTNCIESSGKYHGRNSPTPEPRDGR